MKIFVSIGICFSALCIQLHAEDIAQVCNKLGLYPGSKAKIQWERIFSDPKKMEKYKLDTLHDDTRSKLKVYLIKHAADSEQPMVPGL